MYKIINDSSCLSKMEIVLEHLWNENYENIKKKTIFSLLLYYIMNT